jgi:hypothetical protein
VAEYNQHQPDVIVGSSCGGAVAMNIDSKDTPLVASSSILIVHKLARKNLAAWSSEVSINTEDRQANTEFSRRL